MSLLRGPFPRLFVILVLFPVLLGLADPDAPVERELGRGETHSYQLDGVAGRPLLVRVEQRGADVSLSASGPGGPGPVALNGMPERWGTESLLISPDRDGVWTVEVRPARPSAPPGRYGLRFEELAAEERGWIEAERRMTEAAGLARPLTEESLRKAASLYGESLQLWRGSGRRQDEARALFLIAAARQELGEPREAVAPLEAALAIWTAEESPGDRAQALTALGIARWHLGDNEAALGLFEEARAIWRSLKDRGGEAGLLSNAGLVRHARGEWPEAAAAYEEALRLYRETGDPEQEARVLINLGGAWDLLGEPQEALASYGRALELARSLGDTTNEARTLNNLGVLHGNLGEMDEALRSYEAALPLFRARGDRLWEARVLNNLGFAYRGLGEPRRAISYLEPALALRREAGDRRGEAITANNLGLAHQALGEPDEARAWHERALQLARQVEDRKTEASSLSHLAQARLASGDPAQAVELLGQATALLRDLGDRRGLAQALHRAGEIRQSIPLLEEALALRRDVEDRAGEAETLTALARAERGLGLLPQSLARAEEALGRIESLRTRVTHPDLRASFLASQQRAFELAIGLRLELDRHEPGRGHAEAAFALAERARARSLLELLGEARADLRQGVAPELLERRRELSRRLAAKAQRRMELPAGPAAEPRKAILERELRELLAQADQVDSEILRQSPRHAGLVRPRPVGSGETRALLDPGTLLLEYFLGEERSVLWVLSPEAATAFELPPRAEIEALARRVYEGLRTFDAGSPDAGREEARDRAALSRMVLGPAAALLGERRLAVVPDGALQYVPFAALPVPGPLDDPKGAFLVERHEIVSLPSASVLAVQRRGLGERSPAPGLAVVVADPVFDARDPRIHQRPGAPSPAEATARSLRGPAPTRLPASALEAEAIAALLSPDRVSTVLGLQAHRGAVLDGGLGGFRIVHLATHGWIDAEVPALSGLVLSTVDGEGRPREGFLGLGDIYDLKLDADLVVLSGCETALGREVRGEGLIGLARGFLHAGAREVAASLWRVQDRATAELMTRLYRAMIESGRPPSAALREAQLAMLAERRWRDPFFWSPFVLVGDWK